MRTYDCAWVRACVRACMRGWGLRGATLHTHLQLVFILSSLKNLLLAFYLPFKQALTCLTRKIPIHGALHCKVIADVELMFKVNMRVHSPLDTLSYVPRLLLVLLPTSLFDFFSNSDVDMWSHITMESCFFMKFWLTFPDTESLKNFV